MKNDLGCINQDKMDINIPPHSWENIPKYEAMENETSEKVEKKEEILNEVNHIFRKTDN